MCLCQSSVNMSIFQQHTFFFLYAFYRHIRTVVPVVKQKSITCETAALDIWQMPEEM